MKFLITGKDGQASLAFADLLDARKEKYVALGRKELDITDLKAVREAVLTYKPEAVFNGAAYNDVDKAESDWEQAFLVNGIGPRNLAIACEEAGIPLVTFSTDYVFDGTKGSPYTVADAPNPINAYGKSKLLGEHYVQSLCRKYILARVSWVFGVKGKAESCFPKKVLKWAETKTELRVVDDQVSSPTYAPDLAEAVYALLQERAWGLCHITNTGSCSRYEWAKTILSLWEWKGKLLTAKSCDFETAAQRPEFSVLDVFPIDKAIEPQQWQKATEKFVEKTSRHDKLV
jgi:dTDP-4-dehydrorhamnose reductase